MDQQHRKLRNELVINLDGGNAHMSFEEAVADFPIELINSIFPEIHYSPWHFLEHMRISQWDILQFIINPKHVSPDWPSGYRPRVNELSDKRKWETTVSLFKKDLCSLQEIASDQSIDLFSPIAHAPEYTVFRELLTASSHNSYHIGEFAILRQALKAWPKDRPYLTG
ncbi:MAG TPA: hypothetical protein VHP36_10570 [Chitinispirillaceae bacterium]|nr:hypothetical protein [Chitinispirillaceae bacterium]